MSAGLEPAGGALGVQVQVGGGGRGRGRGGGAVAAIAAVAAVVVVSLAAVVVLPLLPPPPLLPPSAAAAAAAVQRHQVDGTGALNGKVQMWVWGGEVKIALFFPSCCCLECLESQPMLVVPLEPQQVGLLSIALRVFFSQYSNACPATHHYMHASNIGWDVCSVLHSRLIRSCCPP